MLSSLGAQGMNVAAYDDGDKPKVEMEFAIINDCGCNKNLQDRLGAFAEHDYDRFGVGIRFISPFVICIRRNQNRFAS